MGAIGRPVRAATKTHDHENDEDNEEDEHVRIVVQTADPRNVQSQIVRNAVVADPCTRNFRTDRRLAVPWMRSELPGAGMRDAGG